MEIIQIPIENLKFADYNPRFSKKRDVEDLTDSIKRFGFVDPIIINSAPQRKNIIIGGHFRVKVAKNMGIKKVPAVFVNIPDLKKEKELNLRLNKNTGRWDIGMLANFDEKELLSIGWTNTELDEIFNMRDIDRKKLKDIFIIPPFSIFDARQGYWQKRKKEWLRLGIKSELGRDKDLLLPQERLNRIGIKYKTGTSIFDPVLCEVVMRWFCSDNGLIIDPFAGGSVRGVIATFLGYDYIGIDLSAEQIGENRKQAKKILETEKETKIPKWIIGNSLRIKEYCKDIKADFLFSCPPYFDLEQYKEKEDLSNLNWEDFKVQYSKIIKDSCDLLKNDRFACFVVSEIRDKKTGFYRNFVDFTKSCFLEAGLKFYNEIILINQLTTLPARVSRQFDGYRKVGKTHQNILVFYKGDPKKIKENFKSFKKNEIN